MKYAFIFSLVLAAAPLFAASGTAGNVVCTNCLDTGAVKIKCPLCKGTKFLWKCPDTSYQNGTCRNLEEKGAFCGYGAVYKPLHPNCKNSRTRINCPMCLSKSKSSSTGIAELPCPNCDGKGHLSFNLIAVKDEGAIVQFDLDFTLPRLEKGQNPGRENFVRRRFSSEEIADFATVYPYCRFFHTPEQVREFVKKTLIEKLASGYTTSTITRNGKPIDYGQLAAPSKKSATASASSSAETQE